MTDCVIYTRVSSKEQEEGFSLDAQEEILRKYANAKEFQITHEYREVHSAKAPGRPKFQHMLDYLRVNPETVVLVEKTDRLSRNWPDYLTICGLQVEIHLVKESRIIDKNSTSNDIFIQGIMVLDAIRYSGNLSEEIVKGMTKRAEAGKWSCKAPYGYRNNPETDILEAVPAEAEAVRWLFKTYATGEYSLRELCAEFRRRAFPWRNSKPIYTSLADKMLNNSFYIGIVKWGKVTAQGEHEPIIDPALWSSVQKVIHQRSRPKTAKHPFPYRGLIRCGHCGCLMTGSINKGHRYYKCSNARGKCTGNGYIREDKLTGIFTDRLKRIALPEADRRLITSAIKDFKRAEVDEHDKEKDRVSREATRLQTMLDSTYDHYLSGDIDRDMWQRAQQRHSEKLAQVKIRIQQLDTGDTSIFDRAERLIDTAFTASGEFHRGNPAKKREILKAVVSNCTMTSGNLHHSYKKPFDLLAEGSSYPDWWS